MNLLHGKAALLLLSFLSLACKNDQSLPEFISSSHDLHFDSLPDSWDEGIPLGNGMVGALIWLKEGKLRLSLDRADLWDLRPMENLNTPEWKYRWVYEQWKHNEYEPVQKRFDEPYDQSPAPSKIPGAALEFDISRLGPIQSVHLYLDPAICEIHWVSGAKLQTFVHATDAVGWYTFKGLAVPPVARLIPPVYESAGHSDAENPVTGQDLRRLGYPQGIVKKEGQAMTYDQQGWGNFKYQVYVKERRDHEIMEGCWSISTNAGDQGDLEAKQVVANNLEIGFESSMQSHLAWWSDFWSKSKIEIPNKVLQKQWYLEQYKFGCAARAGAPPISLQAVWTADNGKLPPWKGDFHHDLNTQLSYWPAYSANHLEEEAGFIEWLWNHRETFTEYTRSYFESEGLNVPGVSTLVGEPMGGWIQYAFGPTVSAWLAHHFYLHWQYTMDKDFLKKRAYPWIKEVAVFLEDISEIDPDGKAKVTHQLQPGD